MLKKYIVFSVLLVLLGGLAHAGVAEVKARKKLVVLSYPHAYSAFVRENPPGQYEGVDISILKTFANKLGVALEIHPVKNLNDLIPELLAGKGDLLASGFSITPEREKILNFSEPYFPVVVMVLVHKDSKIAAVGDLRGKKGSVVAGSSKEDRLKKIAGAQAYHVEKSSMHYEAVESKKADFALVDSPSWLLNEKTFPNLKLAFQFPEIEYYGYATAPGNDLIEMLNVHLQEMRDSGTMQTLLRRQLGDKAVEMMALIKK